MEVKVVEENNERLDKYLASKLEISRTLISKMIDNEYILVNEKKSKSNYKVRVNDLITIESAKELVRSNKVVVDDVSFLDNYVEDGDFYDKVKEIYNNGY